MKNFEKFFVVALQLIFPVFLLAGAIHVLTSLGSIIFDDYLDVPVGTFTLLFLFFVPFLFSIFVMENTLKGTKLFTGRFVTIHVDTERLGSLFTYIFWLLTWGGATLVCLIALWQRFTLPEYNTALEFLPIDGLFLGLFVWNLWNYLRNRNRNAVAV